MAENAPGGPTPPLSINFVFDSGVKKIEQQEKLIDSLDVKMGVLIGLLGAFIVGLLAAVLTSEASHVILLVWGLTKVVFLLGIVLLFICLICAYQSFKARQYYYGIPFGDLIEWTNEDPGIAKTAFLPTLYDAIKGNDIELDKKQRWARRAIVSVFGALVVLCIGMMFLGAQALTERIGL